MLPRMERPSRRAVSAALAYGVAVAAVALSTVVTLLLNDPTIRSTLFFPAILLSAWFGGWGPGLGAVVLAALSYNFFFTHPRFTLYVGARDIPDYAVFIVSVLIVGWWSVARRRAEDALRQARDELEAKSKELEAFAYSVSHDLRAPLRHVVGYTELLSKRAAATMDGTSRRYMTTIQDSARRMGVLIDDLLAFSRVGRVEMQRTSVNLGQLVKEAVSEVRPETDGREIAWKIGALPTVAGDRAMLRLALVNLVSNAVKFTRTRPRTEIEIGSTDGKPGEVVVFVRDNGVGFDMKYVDKLFGVFRRLHQAEEFEGTGIGLASVHRIVQRHQGRVWAEGVVDHGATFYFAVPRAAMPHKT
jgi:light-regulated signal transduction histidine kinase (bacteriophytochrome)